MPKIVSLVRDGIVVLLEGRVKIAHPDVRADGYAPDAEIASEDLADEGIQDFLKRGFVMVMEPEVVHAVVPAVEDAVAHTPAPVEVAGESDAPSVAASADSAATSADSSADRIVTEEAAVARRGRKPRS